MSSLIAADAVRIVPSDDYDIRDARGVPVPVHALRVDPSEAAAVVRVTTLRSRTRTADGGDVTELLPGWVLNLMDVIVVKVWATGTTATKIWGCVPAYDGGSRFGPVDFAALERPRLALDALMVWDGDSHAAQGIGNVGGGGTGDRERRYSWGVLAANFALSPGYVSPSAYVGVAGETMAQILARQAATLALDPAVIGLSGGGNDLAANRSAAATLADVDAYCTAAWAAGVQYVIMPTLWARYSANAFTAAQEVQRGLFNAGLRARDGGRFIVADVADVIDDVGLTVDNVHLNGAGALAEAPVTAACIRQAWAPGADAITLLDAAANVYSRRPTGTGGTATSVTGAVAAGFTLSASSAGGLTVAGSKDAIDDGQIITLSGAKTGASREVNFSIAVAIANLGMTLAVGDLLQAIADFEVVTTLSNVAAIDCEFWVTSADFATVYLKERGLQSYAGDVPIEAGRRIVQRTPVGALRAGTYGYVVLYVKIQLVDGSVSPSGAIKLNRFGLRKIV